jgi:uncharacterized protein (TIGR03000 family)
MFRRMVTRLGILATGGIGLLLVAGPAHAQQGWPYAGGNPYYGGGGGSSSGSYSRSYYSPSYSTPTYYSRSYYAPPYYAAYPLTAESPQKRSARINFQVPSDAKIWFGESDTVQTGMLRTFESPPLPVGSAYSYQVRVQWKHDGKDVTEDRNIIIHAGDVINLTLGSAPGVALSR